MITKVRALPTRGLLIKVERVGFGGGRWVRNDSVFPLVFVVWGEYTAPCLQTTSLPRRGCYIGDPDVVKKVLRLLLEWP